MSTFNGAIRIYMPGLEQETEDPFRHPLWLCPPSGRNPRAVDQIAARVLPLGFRDADGDARFWRVGLLRQATSRAIANSAAGSREDQLSAEIAALRAEVETAKESAEAAEALMDEAASKLSSVQAENAELQDENHSLRQRLRTISLGGAAKVETSLSPEEIYSIFEQDPRLETALCVISKLFSDRVVVLDTAIESARDSYAFRYRKKAFELLWSLCTTYWDALSNGESDVTARKCFGSAYAAKEAETLPKGGRKRRTFHWNGRDIEMERHLKIGTADNKTETLRIHFEWVGDQKLIVIGHCGGHINFS